MNNKEFLNEYPLEYCLPSEESKALEKVLKMAFESYSIEYTKSKGIKTDIQYYDFVIICEKTNFAQAYAHIGLLYAQFVLPIWQKRFNIKPTKI